MKVQYFWNFGSGSVGELSVAPVPMQTQFLFVHSRLTRFIFRLLKRTILLLQRRRKMGKNMTSRSERRQKSKWQENGENCKL